jgi:hypothetical protein
MVRSQSSASRGAVHLENTGVVAYSTVPRRRDPHEGEKK